MISGSNREILALFVLLTGLVGVAVIGYIGVLPSSRLSAYSTAILVVVTLYYAILNQGMLRETRRERELSQELLEETRKERVRDDVIETIIKGIDKMASLLNEHQQLLNNSPDNDGRTSFPILRWHDPFSNEILLGSQIIDRPIWIDIQQDYDQLPESFKRYEKLCSGYIDLYHDTQDDLKEYIKNEFIEENKDKIEEIDGEKNMPVDEEIQEHSSKLATRILSAFEDPAYGYSEINQDLLLLRDSPFADEIERMEELILEIVELNEELSAELSTVREEYKSEYSIRETKLSEEKAGKEN